MLPSSKVAPLPRPPMTNSMVLEAGTPIPPNNSGATNGAVARTFVGRVPVRGYYRIRVTGGVQIHTSQNWSTKPCAPRQTELGGQTVGPMGLPYPNSGVLRPWIQADGVGGLNLTGLDATTAEVKVALEAGAAIYFERTGIAGGGQCTPTDYYYMFDLGGDQRITVEKLDVSLRLSADRTEILQGDQVAFTASAPEGHRSSFYYFREGDTLATPAGFGGAYAGCYYTNSCTYAPRASGRMYVIANVPGGQQDTTESPVVRLVPPSLRLTCSPSRVPRGNTTTCTATAQPSGASFVVESFSYSGAAEPLGQAGDLKTWTFKPGVTGIVAVRATVGDTLLSATAQVEVVCNFFKSPTGDRTLDDAALQQHLRHLWESSNPGDPGPGRIERGAFILERGGTIEILEWTGPATRCDVKSGNASAPAAARVLGMVHTHPDPKGTPMPDDGSCLGNTEPARRFRDGPSVNDLLAARSLNRQLERNGRPRADGYVIDRDHVHRFGGPSGGGEFPRNQTCTVS